MIQFDKYKLKANFDIIKYKKVLVKKNQIQNYKKHISNIRKKVIKKSNIHDRYKNNDKNQGKLKTKF